MTLIPKQEIVRDEKYRRWIADLPCIVCGRDDVQAAHIRIGAEAGMGRKPSDSRILPLCCQCHKNQHESSELVFYHSFGGWEFAVSLAKKLYENRYDTDKAIELISKWRRKVWKL